MLSFFSTKRLQAVKEMHETQLDGSERKLFVCRAQKKSERQADLKRKYEMQKVRFDLFDISSYFRVRPSACSDTRA